MIKILKVEDTICENIEAFHVNEDDVTVWNVPQNVDDLKVAYIDTVKWQSGHKLKDTDWAVVKCTELGLVLADKYPTIATERATVREWSNTKEVEILACSTVDEVLVLDIKL